jgi:hypothetical protein
VLVIKRKESFITGFLLCFLVRKKIVVSRENLDNSSYGLPAKAGRLQNGRSFPILIHFFLKKKERKNIEERNLGSIVKIFVLFSKQNINKEIQKKKKKSFSSFISHKTFFLFWGNFTRPP